MKNTALKLVSLVVALIYLPWSLFLTYLILEKIDASELMWFLFILLIPIALVTSILSKVIDWSKES